MDLFYFILALALVIALLLGTGIVKITVGKAKPDVPPVVPPVFGTFGGGHGGDDTTNTRDL